jgi:hypothetical protein
LTVGRNHPQFLETCAISQTIHNVATGLLQREGEGEEEEEGERQRERERDCCFFKS